MKQTDIENSQHTSGFWILLKRTELSLPIHSLGHVINWVVQIIIKAHDVTRPRFPGSSSFSSSLDCHLVKGFRQWTVFGNVTYQWIFLGFTKLMKGSCWPIIDIIRGHKINCFVTLISIDFCCEKHLNCLTTQVIMWPLFLYVPYSLFFSSSWKMLFVFVFVFQTLRFKTWILWSN